MVIEQQPMQNRSNMYVLLTLNSGQAVVTGREAEMAAKGYNFNRLEKMAKNRVRWKHIVDGL